ncbi:MAG: FAD-dependent oxidoreductase [Nocardioidaceae bacterium]
MTESTAFQRQADVIIVGAGPAGSTAAAYLASAGVDVLLLEKISLPAREGLRRRAHPRAVRQLISMGIDVHEPGWIKNKGLRIVGGGHRLELPWPDLADYPSYGLVRTRLDFDDTLARHAQKAGARLHELTAVTGPIRAEQSGRITGVTGPPSRRRGAQGRRRSGISRTNRHRRGRQLHPLEPCHGPAEA